MRSSVVSIVLAIIFSEAVSAQSAAPALPTVTLPPALDRVLRDYERAWRARDAADLAGLFTEDGFVLSNGSPPVRGRAAIRAAYANGGGPLALRALAYATKARVGYIIGGFGTGGADTGKFVLALRKEGGLWRIAADMDNSNRGRMTAPTPIPMPAPVTPPSSGE